MVAGDEEKRMDWKHVLEAELRVGPGVRLPGLELWVFQLRALSSLGQSVLCLSLFIPKGGEY